LWTFFGGQAPCVAGGQTTGPPVAAGAVRGQLCSVLQLAKARSARGAGAIATVKLTAQGREGRFWPAAISVDRSTRPRIVLQFSEPFTGHAVFFFFEVRLVDVDFSAAATPPSKNHAEHDAL